ncbi:MAG: hypothetical protein ACKVTZ_21000 [Bacteroidia bacterium]
MRVIIYTVFMLVILSACHQKPKIKQEEQPTASQAKIQTPTQAPIAATAEPAAASLFPSSAPPSPNTLSYNSPINFHLKQLQKAGDLITEVEKKEVLANCMDSIPSQKATLPELKEETLLIGKEGTYFTMYPNSFVDENGKPVNKNVSIELKELNFSQDLWKTGITTTSNKAVLASGGTFYLNATCEGKQLQINPEVGVYFAIPTTKKDSSMELFKGEENWDENDINWIVLRKEEEKPPVPQKPTEEEETETLHDLDWIRRMNEAIEQGDYVLKGDYYVAAKTSKEDTHRTRISKAYIEKCKEWYNKTAQKELVIMQRNEMIRQAKARYLAAYKAYYSQEISEMKKISAYEYRINSLGWYNCDKFVKGDIGEFSGKIVDKNGNPATWVRIHLLAQTARIHLKTKIKDKPQGFSFRIPKNTPFEIIIARGKKVVKKEFSGKDLDLGEIVF